MKDATWQFYLSSPPAWEAMLSACQAAQVSIDLEQFILSADRVGEQFVDVCCERARAGVKVRLICDAGGSLSLFHSPILKRLEEAGVAVVPFNTFTPGSFYNHTVWFFRDHQKLLIIDGKIGFTGGICLDADMRTWRDTHVQVTGPVVAEMQQQFELMWLRANKKRARRQAPPATRSATFSYVTNSPFLRQRQLYQQIIAALRNAKERIRITTPYFVPDGRLLRVLELAARRGVHVELLLPHSSDHSLVDLAGRSYFERLLKRGVRIHQYQGTMIHAKTIIVDNNWSTVGSFNLDHVSIYYNFEANLISADQEFAAELDSHFESDIKRATELSLEVWRHRSLSARLAEWLIGPLCPFL